jgi:hypothetical protein
LVPSWHAHIDLKNSIFWDITPCSVLKVNRLFGGNVLSIFRIEEQTKLHAGFVLGLLLIPGVRGDMLPRSVSWLSADYTALYPRRYNSS